VGVWSGQRVGDCCGHSVGIAKHVVIPEPQDAIALSLDNGGSRSIMARFVLPAVYFDDQPCSMTCEVDDEMSDWGLAAKAGIEEILAQ
jgi:hypothetical protein